MTIEEFKFAIGPNKLDKLVQMAKDIQFAAMPHYLTQDAVDKHLALDVTQDVLLLITCLIIDKEKP